MSEKRRRQQQRRARRRAAGSSQAKNGGSGGQPAIFDQFDPELDEMLAGVAEIAARDSFEPQTPLEAEHWASCLFDALDVGRIIDPEVRGRFRADLVRALEALGTGEALATLRALSGVGIEIERMRARAAAGRLASTGLAEPPWATGVGCARPVAAAQQYEEAFDDGVSVMIEFDGHDNEPHTLGIYIDHNMGGLVKDVFLAGPLSEVRPKLNVRAPNGVRLGVRDLDLAEARARVMAALDVLDHTYAPPVDEDVSRLRALIDARIDLLPDGFALDDEYEEIPQVERDRMLEAFLKSRNGQRWRGDEDAEDVVATAIDFGADYNYGGPLRWSPVVVEIFMTGWVARKVIREPAYFELMPEVLADWVAYAGAQRGVRGKALREAIDAVATYREEMLDAIGDPDAWGPAKAFAAAAQAAGVDLSDRGAVDEFVEQYNEQLAS